jgi:hypothetical protein
MFYRGLGNISANEALLYNHYTVVCTLLEYGFTKADVDEMHDAEITMILAIMLAKKERENEEQARAQRM